MGILIKEFLTDNLPQTGSTEILDVQVFHKYFESYETDLFTKLKTVLPKQALDFKKLEGLELEPKMLKNLEDAFEDYLSFVSFALEGLDPAKRSEFESKTFKRDYKLMKILLPEIAQGCVKYSELKQALFDLKLNHVKEGLNDSVLDNSDLSDEQYNVLSLVLVDLPEKRVEFESLSKDLEKVKEYFDLVSELKSRLLQELSGMSLDSYDVKLISKLNACVLLGQKVTTSYQKLQDDFKGLATYLNRNLDAVQKFYYKSSFLKEGTRNDLGYFVYMEDAVSNILKQDLIINDKDSMLEAGKVDNMKLAKSLLKNKLLVMLHTKTFAEVFALPRLLFPGSKEIDPRLWPYLDISTEEKVDRFLETDLGNDVLLIIVNKLSLSVEKIPFKVKKHSLKNPILGGALIVTESLESLDFVGDSVFANKYALFQDVLDNPTLELFKSKDLEIEFDNLPRINFDYIEKYEEWKFPFALNKMKLNDRLSVLLDLDNAYSLISDFKEMPFELDEYNEESLKKIYQKKLNGCVDKFFEFLKKIPDKSVLLDAKGLLIAFYKKSLGDQKYLDNFIVSEESFDHLVEVEPMLAEVFKGTDYSPFHEETKQIWGPIVAENLVLGQPTRELQEPYVIRLMFGREALNFFTKINYVILDKFFDVKLDSFYYFLSNRDFSKPAIKLFLMSLFSEQNFLDKMYSVFKKTEVREKSLAYPAFYLINQDFPNNNLPNFEAKLKDAKSCYARYNPTLNADNPQTDGGFSSLIKEKLWLQKHFPSAKQEEIEKISGFYSSGSGGD